MWWRPYLTSLALARAEHLVDATQNLDALVEAGGISKTHAVNLLKISNDLRLLASGPCGGLGEIRLPERQAGSSAMPGKVNPVICEAVAQSACTTVSIAGSSRTMARPVAIAYRGAVVAAARRAVAKGADTVVL